MYFFLKTICERGEPSSFSPSVMTEGNTKTDRIDAGRGSVRPTRESHTQEAKKKNLQDRQNRVHLMLFSLSFTHTRTRTRTETGRQAKRFALAEMSILRHNPLQWTEGQSCSQDRRGGRGNKKQKKTLIPVKTNSEMQ